MCIGRIDRKKIGMMMQKICDILVFLGQYLYDVLRCIMSCMHFIFQICARFILRPLYFRLWLSSCLEWGFFSLFVVAVTSFFAGIVLAVQIYFGFFGMRTWTTIPGIVTRAMIRELGPVLAGLMASGRMGASMAAMISGMRSTQQIDALIVNGVCPLRYIVVPHAIAGLLMMPLLCLAAALSGVLGGFFISWVSFDVPHTYYAQTAWSYWNGWDVAVASVKGSILGLCIVFISAYIGLHSHQDTHVAQIPMRTVVMCSLCVLIINFIMTFLLFQHA